MSVFRPGVCSPSVQANVSIIHVWIKGLNASHAAHAGLNVGIGMAHDSAEHSEINEVHVDWKDVVIGPQVNEIDGWSHPDHFLVASMSTAVIRPQIDQVRGGSRFKTICVVVRGRGVVLRVHVDGVGVSCQIGGLFVFVRRNLDGVEVSYRTGSPIVGRQFDQVDAINSTVGREFDEVGALRRTVGRGFDEVGAISSTVGREFDEVGAISSSTVGR